MPWSTYEAVTLEIPTAEANRIAAENGASDAGPTFEDWWAVRIEAAASVALGSLRGVGYSPPDAPEDLSAADALLLSVAIAQQAIIDARKFIVRQGGGEKYPVPELGVRLRQILGGIIQLDMPSTAVTAVFIPTPVSSLGAELSLLPWPIVDPWRYL